MSNFQNHHLGPLEALPGGADPLGLSSMLWNSQYINANLGPA